jgi:hypothetical protein
MEEDYSKKIQQKRTLMLLMQQCCQMSGKNFGPERQDSIVMTQKYKSNVAEPGSRSARKHIIFL